METAVPRPYDAPHGTCLVGVRRRSDASRAMAWIDALAASMEVDGC
jgi:hypothetical protein